jgi:hypothetical protein
MSEQENCNTLERFFQASVRHDLAAIDDLVVLEPITDGLLLRYVSLIYASAP